MRRFLLDVNVLIALLDESHERHEVSREWFHRLGSKSWASCPMTQNGLLRIVGHSRYPNSPGSPAIVLELLRVFLKHPGHEFWPDDISLLDERHDAGGLTASSHVTDAYLVALAKYHGGLLATLDQRLVAAATRERLKSLHLIG